MKIFLFTLFVAAAFAAPAPMDEEIGEPVELIVNGVAEGEALDIGEVLGIKVKEHVDGQIVSATDMLHPLTAVGIAEAAAAENPEPVDIIEAPEVVEIKPDPVELPPPVLPEIVPLPPINIPAQIPDYVDIPVVSPPVLPDPIVLPQPVMPEIQPPTEALPEPIVLPEPVMPEIDLPMGGLPEPIEIPHPVLPELELPVEDSPNPAPQFPVGEVFNNGMVQVTLNAPEPSYTSTIQSWFSMVLNYFSGSAITTHQIV